MLASDLAARKAAAGHVEVRDAIGNILQDGDQVVPVKDLDVRFSNNSPLICQAATGQNKRWLQLPSPFHAVDKRA